MASFQFAGGRFGKLGQLGRGYRGRKTKRDADKASHFRPLRLEPMEERALLSTTMQPTYVVYNPLTGLPQKAGMTPCSSATPVGLTPQQMRTAYGLDNASHQPLTQLGTIVGNGAGQTIAIVNAYDDPYFVSSTAPNFLNSDLHKFDTYFGIPDPPSFTKLDQSGGTNYPSADGGWALEEALNVEWAHVIAPNANIVLVEAAYADDSDLIAAVNTARNLPGVSVVSMSYGMPESVAHGGFVGAEPQDDPYYTTPSGHQGVTFSASSGDDSAGAYYPACSPNVVAVGGTHLYVDSNGNYQSESGWSLGGGGISQYETLPSYQNGVTYYTPSGQQSLTTRGCRMWRWIPARGCQFTTPSIVPRRLGCASGERAFRCSFGAAWSPSRINSA